ncbi:NUDIX hydrolase [Spirosoma endbachense]|uniref:GDP-mannose pyrophosphatase n=1 Tax=Spirosoma endbachense TaxID=2666025 RepID=A0A6P1VMX0_9BACT|nr:NUDIX hydrolase [Spirosoma endbachense]QHV94423.1 NUDIX domain-containing protein [Spirosoma endbachense]
MTPDNDPRPWSVESSEYLHQLPWFTVRKDAIRMQNGGTIPNYFVLEYPDWINVVAITTEGQVVLIRQYRHGIAGVHYELCAGVVDPGEEPLVAAQRELLEETGFGGGQWTPLMTLSANPGTHANLTHSFLAIGVEPKQAQHLESTEEITVHIVSPERAWDIINKGEMMQALHLAPLLKYLAER